MREFLDIIRQAEQSNIMKVNQNLHEGVRFGGTEKQQITEDGNILLGMEYEFYTKSMGIETVIEMYANHQPTHKSKYGEEFHVQTIRGLGDSVVYIYGGENDTFAYNENIHHESLSKVTKLDFIQELLNGEVEFKSLKFPHLISNTMTTNEANHAYDAIRDIIKEFPSKRDAKPVFKTLSEYFDSGSIHSLFTLLFEMSGDLNHDDDKADFMRGMVDNHITDEYLDFANDVMTELSEPLKMNGKIEYEVLTPSSVDVLDYVRYVLDEHDIDYRSVEHDTPENPTTPIEIITNPMSVENALKHLKLTFMVIRNHGWVTNEDTGLHVSVSYGGVNERLNQNKFVLLLNNEHVSKLFDERHQVENVLFDVKYRLYSELYSKIVSGSPTKQYLIEHLAKPIPFMKPMVDGIRKGEIMLIHQKNKMQNINVRDYHEMNGRIELRHFGGKDDVEYQNMYSTIEDEVIRAAYMLFVSHSELYEKEYQKAIYQLFEEFLRISHEFATKLKLGQDVHDSPIFEYMDFTTRQKVIDLIM